MQKVVALIQFNKFRRFKKCQGVKNLMNVPHIGIYFFGNELSMR